MEIEQLEQKMGRGEEEPGFVSVLIKCQTYSDKRNAYFQEISKSLNNYKQFISPRKHKKEMANVYTSVFNLGKTFIE